MVIHTVRHNDLVPLTERAMQYMDSPWCRSSGTYSSQRKSSCQEVSKLCLCLEGLVKGCSVSSTVAGDSQEGSINLHCASSSLPLHMAMTKAHEAVP